MIKILLVESSYLVRKGLMHLFNEFQHPIQLKEVEHPEDLPHELANESFDLCLINTALSTTLFDAQIARLIADSTKIIYLLNSPLPGVAPNNQISLMANGSVLFDKLQLVLDDLANNQKSEVDELSTREQHILKQVALGLTNKEIGEKLFISAHTVISHRKNITRKLGIKTVSGLTVYAIINNIISVQDIS